MPLFSLEGVPPASPDGTYTLLVPVALSQSLYIEGEATGTIEGRRAWIRNRGEGRVDIIVTGFLSEEEADSGFESLKSWLVWAALEFGHGLRFGSKIEPISRFEKPLNSPLLGEVTGFANLGPVIFATGERIALESVGGAHVVSGYPAQRLLDKLTEAAGVGIPSMSEEDPVRGAVDLYLATSWEASNYAKFLTLVNVLEVLKDQPALGRGVQELIDRWGRDVDAAEEAGHVDRDEAKSLKGSLERLRRRSLGKSIRALVLETLEDPVAAKEVATIYDERSKLVHDGIVPPALTDRVAALLGIIPRVLQSRLTHLRSTHDGE